MRRDYGTSHRYLMEGDLAPTWYGQLDRWFTEALADGRISQPQAAVLATASVTGMPSIRTVLLKSYGPDGLVFATNRSSAKGRDLAGNPVAALCFPWAELERQVIVLGSVSRTTDAESDAIFAERPRGAQIAAWASRQSTVVESRAVLESRRADVDQSFPGAVARPPHWGGYRIEPLSIEFWQGQADRFHDRLRFRLQDGSWLVERLAP